MRCIIISELNLHSSDNNVNEAAAKCPPRLAGKGKAG